MPKCIECGDLVRTEHCTMTAQGWICCYCSAMPERPTNTFTAVKTGYCIESLAHRQPLPRYEPEPDDCCDLPPEARGYA